MSDIRRCILINVRTQKKRKFDSVGFAELFLGQKPGYISRRVTRGEKIWDYRHRQAYEAKIMTPQEWETESNAGKIRSMQLCWNCKHACGGCSWSRNFTPVEGWTAAPTVINVERTRRGKPFVRSIASYDIQSCPQFVRG